MIVTVTLNPSFDKSIIINNFRTGSVNKIEADRIDPGGKGINVSKVLNVLGCKNIATGIAGLYDYDTYEAMLDFIDIKSDFVITKGSIRTNIKICDHLSGITTDINEAGISHSEEILTKLKNKLLSYGDDTVFVISGSIGQKTDPKLIGGLISQLGKRVIVDTSGKALKEAVKAKPYIIKPNLNELSELMGKRFSGGFDIIKSAKELVSTGIHGVMVTMGGNGLLYVTENNAYLSTGIKVDTRCTVGAGDAVTAGIAYSVEKNMSTRELVPLTAALGTAAVMTDGSQAPSLDDIKHYMDIVDVIEL